MKRIRNLKLSKTDNYIASQWMQIQAEKHRYLSSSEWTQSADNVLTFESYVRWTDWRSRIRNVNEDTYDSPEAAKEALDALFNDKPTEDTTSIAMRQEKYPLDISSIDAARRDAKKIVNIRVANHLENVLPENIHFITLKYQSLNEWYKSGLETFEHFPLLSMHQKIHNYDITNTIDSIHTLHKLAVDEVSALEEWRFNYNDYIDHATTIQQIIDLVKRMHGY